jgi:Flp pilus assembly protein TadD
VRNKKLWAAALAIALPLLPTGCISQPTTPAPYGAANKSWTSRFSGAVKDGADKATTALTPKAEPPADPISLSTKPKKKTPELYVAMGLAQERAAKTAEAEKMYKKALEIAPDDAAALLAYGHLLDRRGQLAEATKHYKKCCKKHPENAAAFNDLGLCLHRQGQLPESATALREAVRLQPDRKLYSNNLATVLVEQGRRDEAFKILATAHGTAAAHYNVGYLLQQQGDKRSALEQFQMALNTDPSMTAAQDWVSKLSASDAPMMAKSTRQPASYALESPVIEVPSQAAPSGQYTATDSPAANANATAAQGSYYDDAASEPRHTTRAYPVKYPTRSYEAADSGEVPPTPADAGVELLPPLGRN